MKTALFALVAVALVSHLLLGGAGVIRLLVQLPARRRLGPVAFARYARASDLGNGLVLYPLLGAGGPLATWAALAVAADAHQPGAVTLPLALASALSLLHSLTTAQAAPTMMRIGRAGDHAEVLAPLVERFARWSLPRTILQVLNAAALLWALLALRPGQRIASSALLAVVVAATSFESVLAGTALDQVVVQVPARRRIGGAASAAYLRATDLAAGRVFYPLLGLCGNATTVAGFALALWLHVAPLEAALLGVATAGGVAAFLITRRVIPVASQLAAGEADGAAGSLVERFDRSVGVRAPLFLLVFGCLLAVLAAR